VRSATEYVEVDVPFTEREIEVLRRYAAHLDLSLEETAALAIEASFQEIAADLGAESVEDLDPEALLDYLLGARGDDR
jgi:hypothetical protein